MTALMDLALAPITLSKPRQVKTARHLIRAQAAKATSNIEALDHLELLASEVITNALRHGTGTVRVSVSFPVTGAVERVRVEVRDDGPGFVVADSSDHGRGLDIVNALAFAWGREVDGEGTFVYFEVAL